VDLTARERQIYELRHSTDPPMVFRLVGDSAGCAMVTARTIYNRACSKLRDPTTVDARTGGHANAQSLEFTSPEIAAQLIDTAVGQVNPNLAEAARECGMPVSAANHLMDRANRRYQPVIRELARIKTDTLVREFEHLGLEALQSITTSDLENVNAYQRALIAAISIDKRELLDGRPTERISVEDRRKLPEIINALMIEAERRGYMKVVNPETGKASLAVREDAPIEVLTHRDRMPAIGVEKEDHGEP
jgi:hypothetical protein